MCKAQMVVLLLTIAACAPPPPVPHKPKLEN